MGAPDEHSIAEDDKDTVATPLPTESSSDVTADPIEQTEKTAEESASDGGPDEDAAEESKGE